MHKNLLLAGLCQDAPGSLQCSWDSEDGFRGRTRTGGKGEHVAAGKRGEEE